MFLRFKLIKLTIETLRVLI